LLTLTDASRFARADVDAADTATLLTRFRCTLVICSEYVSFNKMLKT
jgi:hypothetical protein